MDISSFLDRCRQLEVLVIGDLMLDRYLWGNVERISPEAPVPIVDIWKEESRLGGAANVALNVAALGAKPVLCGLVGEDGEGEKIMELVEEKGFSADLILTSPLRRTTVKSRVIGNQQQILRVDKEDRFPLYPEEQLPLVEELRKRVSGYDAIIFEDYDKHLLTSVLIQEVIQAAEKSDRPVMVDPKFNQFFDYAGCTLFKPNLKELNEGLGFRLDKDDYKGIHEAVLLLRERMPHDHTLVTLSENGMLLVDDPQRATHIPAHYRQIVDVSGAGDTVISVAALGLAAGLSSLEATQLANLAGGLVCEEVGVVPIQKERLLQEAIKL